MGGATSTTGDLEPSAAALRLLFAFLLCVAGAASIGPWLWIAYRRGLSGSAWGACASEEVAGAGAAPGLDVAHERRLRLRGRKCWLHLLLGATGLLILYHVVVSPDDQREDVLFSYMCCWGPAGLLLRHAYWKMGTPHGVEPGLLAIFFLSGGFLGILSAIVLEMIDNAAWQVLLPRCSMTLMNSQYVMTRKGLAVEIDPLTPSCGVAAALMWVLTPGLVEETMKSVWLFFRLRRSEKELPSTCCFCLPATGAFDCGCWFKLAPTPYHVLLCALASGAGFECVENAKYAFMSPMQNDAHDSANIAMMRILTSYLHMAWTGLIGHGLARRMFLPPERRPGLLAVIVPPIVCHGLYDFSTAAMGAVSLRIKGHQMSADTGNLLVVAFLGLLLLTCCGSYCFVLRRFGLRLCPRRCCCAPDFFDLDYAESTARAREIDAAFEQSAVDPSVRRGSAAVGFPVSIAQPLLPA
eukprot:TRINITY_DN15613_c0_g5_i1.p1 TRINITY_DN15613_c0_g5~~TRINITY_DN15613_c0_g5_i1.p1  ORF type:complete len:467 (-),score=95.11 TRINITY_DN15613_c0_g5_i1:94-1494(-)